MNIYLGGPSAYAQAIESLGDLLPRYGVYCTHPWWREVQAAEADGVEPNSATLPATVAASCLEGVAVADVVVAVVASKGVGVWVELGYALALGKPVVLVRLASAPPSVFDKLCTSVLDVEGDGVVVPETLAAVCRRAVKKKARA